MQTGQAPNFFPTAWENHFEQMRYAVKANALTQSIPAEMAVSREWVRSMCEPLFEDMITAMQHSLQQAYGEHILDNADSMQTIYHPANSACILWQGTPFFQLEEASTEATDSCAFTSLLSGNSSDEALESGERKSETSEPSVDGDKTVMVCRHWRSKGWCRLEANCKFLHPENKRGICTPKDCTDAGALAMVSAARRKRGGKNRSGRVRKEQCANEEQQSAIAQ
jgi:hypothetical protein